MSSILSAQNLQTLRRRNIGRRWPSLPCAPPCPPVLPRPPPPLPKLLFPPFIAPTLHSNRIDRRGRRQCRRAVLHPADDPAAGHARSAGAATPRCAPRASGR